jgi:hypothetical protein
MNDVILARQILEGLVHNLNNQLNLILGYSQRLTRAHPELKECAKIYTAGIMIDDTLKELTQQLGNRSLASNQELCLNDWLDRELVFLQHNLPLKHHIAFERKDLVLPKTLKIAPLYLGLWYESILLKLSSYAANMQIKTGVGERDEQYCLYLIPHITLTEQQIELLCTPPESELIDHQNFPIITVWDSSENAIMGLIR